LLIVTDIFPSREQPIEGVSGKMVADSAIKAGHKNVEYMPEKNRIAGFLKGKLKTGDVVVVMGAGDICKYSPLILKDIKK
jgi:UDP-N-acetylmuramate--alanine ligase